MKVLCLYHDKCIDGAASAAIVKQGFPSTVCVPVQYKVPPPWDLFRKEHTVYIVDFSYPVDELNKIASMVNQVVVLDHHQTFKAQLTNPDARLLADNLKIIVSDDKAGALLTWDYFHDHNYDVPKLIQAISNRDLWNLEDPNTNSVHAYILKHQVSVTWLEQVLRMDYDFVCHQGQALWERRVAKWDALIDELKYTGIWFGHSGIPTMNLHRSQDYSDIGHRINKFVPFAVTYYRTAKHYVCSFRSRKGQPLSLDVAKLLEPYGGGGHKHAAGIRIPVRELGNVHR